MAKLAHLYIENFCCIEKASIPLGNRGLVCITGDNQDTDAADNNGSGKSTIPKALTWVLFGETLDGDRYDEVIRWGATEAEVGISFYCGKELWIVRRLRTKGSPTLTLGLVETKKRGRSKDIEEKDWDGTPKEIQQKIIDLLGQDFRAFCNTTLFGEGDINRFFSSTDAKQKDTLHRILRSDVYKKGEKRLREREVKALKQEVQELTSDVSNAQARLDEYDLAHMEELADQWEDTQEQRIDTVKEQVKSCVADMKTVGQETIVRRKELLQQKGKADKEIKLLDKLKEEKEQLDEALEEKRKESKELEDDRDELAVAIDDKGERLEQIATDECPVCTSPLTKGTPVKYRKKLKTERDRLQSQLDSTGQPLLNLTEAIEKLILDCANVKEKIDAVPDTHEDLPAITSELDRLDATTEERKRSLKERAMNFLADVKRLVEGDNPHDEGLQQARDRIDELKSKLGVLEEALSDKRDELAHYEFWVRGFGSQGLPSLLLDETMPYITERTNAYLETLTDGDITVGFSTQREKKSGEKKDEINKDLTIEGVPGVKPSKGQKRKLEVSSDLALMDLSETREGGAGDLLMMDEVLDGLDSEGVSRVLRLIRDLRGKRSSIFVTTHEPGLAEAFDCAVHVTKKGQSSTVTEVR